MDVSHHLKQIFGEETPFNTERLPELRNLFFEKNV